MQFLQSGSGSHHLSLLVGRETFFKEKLVVTREKYPLYPPLFVFGCLNTSSLTFFGRTLHYNGSLLIRIRYRRHRWLWKGLTIEADLSYQQASRKFAQIPDSGSCDHQWLSSFGTHGCIAATIQLKNSPRITAHMTRLDRNNGRSETVLTNLHEAEDLVQRKKRLVEYFGGYKGFFEKLMRYIGAASEASIW
jgi:hypothetical protein